MKSERRHELQHNELATWLIRAGQEFKPYQNPILAGVALILVILIGYNVWSRIAAAQSTAAWDEVNLHLESGNLPKLAEVVEEYPNTPAAHMAAVVLADSYLGGGCHQLFVNKPTAQQELSKAIQLYSVVLEQSQELSLLERATFGLARAKEAKGNADDIKAAEALYEDVVAKWPNGTFAAVAKQRADDLKQPSTKTLYDDFAKFDPKPAFSKDGVQVPFDLNSLPNEGSAAMPATTFDLKLDGKDKAKGQGKEKAKEPEKKAPQEPSKK